MMPDHSQRGAYVVNKPVLSIAIPTYNRAVFLRELLDELLPQLSPGLPVEVIISDNCSTDETEATVRSFVERGLRVRYLRNDGNIGADANILQCFESASGRYVWVVGDDDILIDKTISKVLHLLNDSDYSLVYMCPYWFRNDFRKERRADPFRRSSEEFVQNLQFSSRVGGMLTFISSVIVNKDQFVKKCGTLDKSVLIGTALPQLGYIFPLLAEGKSFLIVWERIIAARAANTGGYGICDVFGKTLNGMIDSMLVEDPRLAKNFRSRVIHSWFPTAILMTRRGAHQRMKAENVREVLEPELKKYWRYWFYLFPLICLPLNIAEIWNKLVIWLDRIRITFMATERFLFHRHRQSKLRI
jgi:abequosyltransferase